LDALIDKVIHTDESIKSGSIEVLTFQIDTMRFAVDLEEIYELIELDQANQRECQTTRFEEEFMFGNITVNYIAPKVLLRKSAVSSGVLIDQACEICQVSIDRIRPLPGLVKLFNPTRIWGTTLIDQEIFFLIDLQ
jgi:chemotaxis signal transduction protein